MSKKISLSFDKLSKFFEKYKYTISNIYTIKSNITLIQVQTPKYKKTFFIAIPSKYTLTHESEKGSFSKENHSNNIQIHIDDLSTENRSSESTKYLDLFEENGKSSIDFVCLSKDYIILFNVAQKYYTFYKEGVAIDLPPLNPKEVAITDLESEFKNTKQQIHTKQGVKFIKSRLKPNIELDFEEDDECIKDIISETTHKIYLDKKTIVDVNIESDKLNKDIHIPLENTDNIKYSINNLPSSMKDVIVGMIFVCVNINTFFKELSKNESFEDWINKQYDNIEKIELSARNDRMQNIIKKFEDYKKEQFDKLKDIEEKEIDIKDKISRLSSVLLSCNKLNKSTTKIEDQKNLKVLIEKTLKTLDDLNLELLLLRDEVFEILEQCEKKL